MSSSSEPVYSWRRALAVVTVLRIVTALLLPLVSEEAYHWNYARHLDWSYYDHPPMIAWSIALGRLFFGDTVLGVRFVPILYATGMIALMAGLARRCYGERAAFWTVLLVSLQPIPFLVSGSAFPDSPLFFFWALTVYFLWRGLDSGKGLWWLAAGASLGAGMLSKYTTVLLPLSFFAYLVIFKRDRRCLASPWPYLAVVVSLIVFIPVLYWNSTHDWISFRFQSMDRLQEADKVSPVSAGRFLLQHWGASFPLTLPLLGMAVAFCLRSRRREEWFLFFCSLPIFVFFFLISWTRSTHLLWPAPAFLSLSVAMAGVLTKEQGWWVRFYHRQFRWLAALSVVALIGAGLHAAFFLPLLSPLKGLYGWEAVACSAREIRNSMSEDAFYLGIGRKYECTSQLAFHLQAPYDVHGKHLIGEEGLQYEFWSDPKNLGGRDAVVVVEGRDRLRPTVRRLEGCFESLEPAGEISIPVGRWTVIPSPPVEFFLFKARGYRPWVKKADS